MTTQQLLQQCTIDNNIVLLPNIKLERKEYMEVKKALELIGGKWKGGKTQGFVFEQDPTELLQAQASGEQRNLKKEYQFFPTPPAVAKMMMECLPEVKPGYKVLEPSAGDGALIKAFHDQIGHIGREVDCFELMDVNRIKLKSIKGANIIGEDFMECKKWDEYDLVIANPPFTKNQDIDHIGRMFKVCKPSGLIITLASGSWKHGSQKKHKQFREWLDNMVTTEEEIPAGMFKESGTMVSTILLRIVKPLYAGDLPWERPETFTVSSPELQKQAEKFIANRFSSTEANSNIAEDEPITELVGEAQTEESENLPERKCRVCGCTDNDCRQCIKKTGKPCHWVEEDLCSACVTREPEEILKDIKQSMKEADKTFNELEKMLSPKNNDMNFFEQLSNAGSVDITLRIMKKNEKLTVNVMPGSGQSVTQPIIITGTPQDLDAEFFNTLYPQVEEVTGIIHNIERVKSQAIDRKEKSEKKPAETNPPKPSAPQKKAKEKADKKVNVKAKEPVTERANLFEEDNTQSSTDQTDSNDTETKKDDGDTD
ncbi:MAG: PRTRC system protein E [Chitinophagaceae bacterium]|nr:PRTRC system protein E [Chitinophagaceae bacterium]